MLPLWLAAPAWSADAVEKLVQEINGSESFKVRVSAAALLARLKDARAFQALGRAAVSDPHPLVRMTAIRMLSKNPGGTSVSAQQARLALGRAQHDRDPTVRRQATVAMAELERGLAAAVVRSTPVGRAGPGGAMEVVIGSMGDRTGHASKAFRERMRAEIRILLGREPSVRLAYAVGPGSAFLVDGTIAKLSFATAATDVEAACGVELVVSRPPRGIVTVATGEAVVQKPRNIYRPQMREQLEAEALEHAVRSAHENLSRFLAASAR